MKLILKIPYILYMLVLTLIFCIVAGIVEHKGIVKRGIEDLK